MVIVQNEKKKKKKKYAKVYLTGTDKSKLNSVINWSDISKY